MCRFSDHGERVLIMPVSELALAAIWAAAKTTEIDDAADGLVVAAGGDADLLARALRELRGMFDRDRTDLLVLRAIIVVRAAQDAMGLDQE